MVSSDLTPFGGNMGSIQIESFANYALNNLVSCGNIFKNGIVAAGNFFRKFNLK